MSLQCLSTNNNCNMVFGHEDKILIKSLYLKRYTAKRLTDKFPEKSWTWHGGNRLLKKLRDTGTVDNHTTTGCFHSHPHFTKENNYAFECLIFYIFCIEELQAMNLKGNLFAFSSMCAEYLLKFEVRKSDNSGTLHAN